MSLPSRPEGETRSAQPGGCLMSRATHKMCLTLAVAGAALLAGCERPPVNTVQHGFRGLAMVEVYNPRILATQAAINQAPETPAPASPDGPRAGQIYKNLKVLGDLSVGELARNMVAITSWVSPKEGCVYCHVAENYADDSKYTKVVARRMLEMTQHINADWKSHVAETGVTCYTCHRGNPVPAKVWFTPAPSAGARFLAGQNAASRDVAYASLPNDPFTPFLLNASEIRVIGTEPLPAGNRQSTKQTEWTYGLMMHMSQSLGVNCTYCHNSRSFAQWDASTPQRAVAWYSIRMVRDINNVYLGPLGGVFPPNRLGPTGDTAKLNCATCHQGAYKPLYGAQMLKGFPELAGPVGAPAAAPQPVAAAAPDGVPDKLVVLFVVGRSDIGVEALRVIALAAADITARPGQAVDLSGYADKTGNADANLELAKQRAFAVRDALKAAGVGEERIRLKKPEFVIGGAEADARRVEIALAK